MMLSILRLLLTTYAWNIITPLLLQVEKFLMDLYSIEDLPKKLKTLESYLDLAVLNASIRDKSNKVMSLFTDIEYIN